MRILYWHRSLGDGGEGVHIRAMIRAFRARGHEVEVVAPGGDSIDDPGAVSSRTAASGLLSRAPGAVVEAGEIAYGMLDGVRAARAARRFRPDFVYARHAAYTAAPVRAARATGVPLLLEVNAPLALERSGDELRGLVFDGVAERQERFCFAAADRLLVVSTPLAEYLRSTGVESAIEVVPNGIHPEVYAQLPASDEVRAEWGIDPDAVVVGFVGFIREWHGVDNLIRAAAVAARAADRKVVLLVVGDGPALPGLRSLAAEAAAPAEVVFTGRVAHAEVPRWLAAMDVTVSPRSTFYACPLKLIEYMAAGTAVLAPHSANILDVVEADRTALTFPPDDAEALTAQLVRLVRDRSLREGLAAAAREEAMSRRTWDDNARRVEEMATACRRREAA